MSVIRSLIFVLVPFLLWLPTSDANTLTFHEITEARISEAEQRAVSEGKQLLLVLGADWCHDSAALVARFSEPDFNAALQEKYEVLGLDVGYLEYGFDTVARYGLPTYYGTPTVLIIEPSIGQIINRIDYQEWTSAASIPADAYSAYFIEQAFPHINSVNTSLSSLSVILTYERRQAQRVRAGYEVAGELLREYKASDEPPTEEFVSVWEELSEFRNIVPRAIGEAFVTDSSRNLPEFSTFSWESVPAQ